MTDGERAPLFSVLLPSRNRLSLLKHAVSSVLEQQFHDIELVISDNASTDDYAGYVASLNDSRVRCIRTDTVLSVTENWNRALGASRGQYVIMMGDDDALTPGSLERVSRLIPQFSYPDAIYVMAYHYCYPGVFPDAPEGYLAMIKARPLYDGRAEAYVHDQTATRRLGRLALRFRHHFNFNSQHFIWSRAFIDRVAELGPFFQSPYPDFYSSFITMLKADQVVVTPEPEAMIGISRQSFGFFFNNDQIEAGNDFLKLSDSDADPVSSLSNEATAALAFPGSPHYRNWLIAALFVLKNLGQSDELWVDFRRYRRIQLFETTYRRFYLRKNDTLSIKMLLGQATEYEHDLFHKLSWSFAAMRRSPNFSPQIVHHGLFSLHRVHSNDDINYYDFHGHRNIVDAWNWLAQGDRGLNMILLQRESWGDTIRTKDAHIGHLREAIAEREARIAERDLRIRNFQARMSSPSALLLQLMRLIWRYVGKMLPPHRGSAT